MLFSSTPTKSTVSSLSSRSISAEILNRESKPNAFPMIHFPKSSRVVASLSSIIVTTCAGYKEKLVEERFPPVLRHELMPKHVAVIVDGNRRWAVQRNLPPIDGHRAGRKALKKLAHLCDSWGVKALTVFLFSTENWNRPQDEVDSLLALIEDIVNSDLAHDIQVFMPGNRTMLPDSLQKAITQAEETRKNNTGFQFNLAINYSGRYDIVKACKGIAEKVEHGLLQAKDINEDLFEQELETISTSFPCPDLLIRTSGELRMSNFLLWQLAYTELYFIEKLFPDFGEADFTDALASFQKRNRRYGGQKY